MQFAFPTSLLPLWLGVGLVLTLLCYWGLRTLERRRQLRLHRFVEARLAPRLLPGYDVAVRKPLFWLSLAGFVLLLMTFAQPHWGESWMDQQRGSRDILILLDVSKSMNAEDILPSRLERAKSKIESMLTLIPGDRVGLVAFSGEAILLSPLTLDHGYFRSILQTTDTDSLNVMGTDISEALRVAGEVFEEDARLTGDRSPAHRAVWLISDGEQISGDAVSQAAITGREAGIFVMGIGSEQGAVVEYPPWMLRYRNLPPENRQRLTRLDEETMRRIASAANGAYVRTTPTNDDIQYLHQEMEQLRTRAIEDALRTQLTNRYRWPLALALACFLGEGLWLVALPYLRQRKMVQEQAASEVEESIRA